MNERSVIRDQLVHCQRQPIVLTGFTSRWEASAWKPETLVEVFGDDVLQFRVGKSFTAEVQWETECQYVSATVQEFNDWVNGALSTKSALSSYDRTTHWCYADYKYMAQLFSKKPHFLKSVDWSVFGFEKRNGQDSTFWLGSQGSNTVCHYDTYGCNLVAQIYGRKRWVLFPPSDTDFLYATRIPYEESSVFSQVPIKSPDLNRFPCLQQAKPFVVTLEPGDVLFVPPKWWHFVESLETSISINSWIEMDSDSEERLREAVTRVMAFTFLSKDDGEVDSWLNPTEDVTDVAQNLEYVNATLSAVLEKRNIPASKEVPIPSYRKRKRSQEEPLSANHSAEKLKNTEQEQDQIHYGDSSFCINSTKCHDIFTLCRSLGCQAQMVKECSWLDYQNLIGNDKAMLKPLTTKSQWKANKTELTSGTVEREGVGDRAGICNVGGSEDADAKDQSDFSFFMQQGEKYMTANDETAVAKPSCSTSPLASNLPVLPEVLTLTCRDLADVILDPEVVDLICQKLVKRFCKQY